MAMKGSDDPEKKGICHDFLCAALLESLLIFALGVPPRCSQEAGLARSARWSSLSWGPLPSVTKVAVGEAWTGQDIRKAVE